MLQAIYYTFKQCTTNKQKIAFLKKHSYLQLQFSINIQNLIVLYSNIKKILMMTPTLLTNTN
jgi:hypothetical protein